METTELVVRKEITVSSPPERVFRVYTEDVATWWPIHTHSVGQERVQTLVLERRVGGRVYERLDDGTEHDWGEITVWDPPELLSMTWHPGRGPETAQQVEVRFLAEGEGTRVELEHRGWEQLGESAAGTRDSYDSGWDTVLQRFREAV